MVNIVIRKATTLVINGDQVYAVDKQGKPVVEERLESLPTILVVEGKEEGIIFAAKIIDLVSTEFGVKQGILKKEGLEVKINGIKIVFPLEGEAESLVGALKLILSQLKILPSESNIGEEIVKVSEIDLRFKNPVVR